MLPESISLDSDPSDSDPSDSDSPDNRSTLEIVPTRGIRNTRWKEINRKLNQINRCSKKKKKKKRKKGERDRENRALKTRRNCRISPWLRRIRWDVNKLKQSVINTPWGESRVLIHQRQLHRVSPVFPTHLHMEGFRFITGSYPRRV